MLSRGNDPQFTTLTQFILFLLFSFHKHTVFSIVMITVNLIILELSTPFFDEGLKWASLVLREYHAPGP